MKLKCFGHLAGVAAVALLAGSTLDAAVAPRAGMAWNLDVTEGGCMLTGNTTGANPVSIALQTVPGTETYMLALKGKTLPRLRESEDWSRVTLAFGAGQHFESRLHAEWLKSEPGQVLLIDNLTADMIAAFAHASSVSVQGKVSVPSLPLSGNKAAADALTGCVRDQLIAWGADPAQFATGGSTPVALVARGNWLSQHDVAALVRRRDPNDWGSYFRVSIATDGRIDDCAPISDVAQRWRQIVCDAVLKRRLFTPASDAAGQPVRGVAAFRIGALLRGRRAPIKPTP